ncbi:MAG: proline dehydrogenase family protein [Actinomycetota bacterium]|nr:proline dehydrogenase family protein [Actinomycetota bacterium]
MSDLRSGVFRPVVLRLAGHPWFRKLATQTRPGRAVASRFVAGETLDDGMRVARELHRRGTAAMLDLLGENVATPQQVESARDAYLEALTRIRQEPTLDCAISIKLTQLGLNSSVSDCERNVEPILDAAAVDGTLVMIDMESHVHVDGTLAVLRTAHARYPKVGVCLQAYLRRTERDIFDLPAKVRVRLVKGAYLEPPDMVYQDKDDVDAAFARLFTTLLARGHAIDAATHDPTLIEGVRTRTDAIENGWSRVEFQMLYGVRRDLQAELARQGFPLRVYVPYGTEWYPYLTRRLAERPANVWFFVSNLLRSAK